MKNTKAIFNKELVIRIPFNDFTNTPQGKNASVKTGLQRKKTAQQAIGNSGKVLQVFVERANFTKQMEVNKRRTPVVKRLRKRNSNVHYEERESSYEGTPLKVTKTNTKLPIYKQIKIAESKENLKDPYALDVFNEKPKKHPKQSTYYDRSMHEELARIEKREKEKKHKKKKEPVKGYQNTVNNIVKEVMERVKKNQNQNSNLSPVKNNEVKKSSSLLDNELNLSKSEKNEKKGYDAIVNSTIKDIMEKVKNRKTNTTNNSINKQNDSVICKECKSSGHHDDNTDDNLESDEELKGFVTIDSFGLNTFDTSNQSHDNLSGFDKHNSSLPKAISTPRINILSNVCITNRRMENVLYDANNTIELEFLDKSHCTLNTTQYTDDTCESDSDDSEDDPYFGFKEMSTDTPEKPKRKRTIFDETTLPCRFGGNFTRNPHWLRIKSNGLPAVDQEMIIDEEFAKRIEGAFSNNSKPEQIPEKHLVQTSMNDFLENKENNLLDTSKSSKRLSLFDCDDFDLTKSPKIHHKKHVLKECSQVCSTPKENLRSRVIPSPHVSFISSSNEDENNVNVELEEDLHLFEEVDADKKTDFSIKIPIMTYAKKPKKKRAVEDEEYTEKPASPIKKKKKNAMTKAEEAAFEKWAEETNAAFSEVDKFELTIL
ncbi:unnamed protein product [Phyllotreta striolata]|uniref:Uncharacterized protein n=1 Tax=Phyllotreta striolata TaxID=444603 RepID=A0A9N9TDY6_PHYSR|nr:unnamed protein product [Phyllotreta striolata]